MKIVLKWPACNAGYTGPLPRPMVLDTNVVLDMLIFDDPHILPIRALVAQGAVRWIADQTQRIELALGRVRKDERWGPRTLDLDLLLFGEQCLDDARLTIPHYGMKERAFVLVPLFDLAPDLQLPCGSWLRDLVASCDRSGLRPLAESSQA